MAFGHRGDARRSDPVGRLARKVDAAEPDASCERRQHTGHAEHERRFAGTVGPKQRRHTPWVELDVDIANDDPFTAGDAEALDDEMVAHASSSATPRYAARTFGSLSEAAVGP